jgi:CBS domain containing-hemolysin-like protein
LTNLAQLIGALLLVLLNGFFVAAEFSLARARHTRMEQLVESGSASAALAQREIKHIDRYLAACQLGITLASLGLGWLGEPAFAHLIEPVLDAVGLGAATTAVTAGILAFAIITVLHVVIGELAPKTIAIQRAERTASWVARPLEWFRFLFAPIIWTLNGAGNGLVRLMGIQPASEHDLASTPEDFQILIEQSERGGAIDPEEADMLEGVFSLHETPAREIMTPRPAVTVLGGDLQVREALKEALATRHSRFPVMDEDSVLGIIHLSGLARGALERGDSVLVREIVARPLFVPETQPVDELLRELQRQRTSLAIVLDEYGDFAGVVAIEDVVEEIVGEIHDERDRGAYVDRMPDGRLMVRGHVPLEDLDDYGVEIEEESITSVGGLIFTRLGRLPQTGEMVEVAGWRLTVEAIRGTRIALVSLERLPGLAGQLRERG